MQSLAWASVLSLEKPVRDKYNSAVTPRTLVWASVRECPLTRPARSLLPRGWLAGSSVQDTREGTDGAGPSFAVRSARCYATAATPLLCATTLPVVIFGAFGIAVLK